MKPARIATIILLVLMTASTAAFANDIAIAGKLKGNWQGYWKMGNRDGRVSASITGSEENRLQGEIVWFGLVQQTLKLPFDKAEVRDGTFRFNHDQGITIDAKVSADRRVIKGNWGSAAGGGTLELKKIH